MERKANSAMYGYMMQQLVGDIFVNAGYVVEREFKIAADTSNYYCDILATRGDIRLAIEVKAYKMNRVPISHLMPTIDRLVNAIHLSGEPFIPVMVIVGKVSENLRNMINDHFASQVLVIDIQHLLFMVQTDQGLRDRLVSTLEYSVDDILPLEPPIRLHRMSLQLFSSDIELLIQKIREWKPQKSNSVEYEQLCCEVLRKVFADDLSLWRSQQKSDDGLFRFDLICKIKNGNAHEFWGMAERYFNSKYIVFEFKNYHEEVTQKEIFTTVKYLYMKALRGVAILVSVNGIDNHADKAIRGILREEGKLIIALSNEDLIKMLELKRDKLEPSDYLSDKLDELLIDLEK